MMQLLRYARVILVYLDWIGILSILGIFGVIVWSKSIWVSMVVFLTALILLWIMFEESSKRYSKKSRISAGKPLGYPLMDCSLGLGLILCFNSIPSAYTPLIICTIVTLILDFLLWIVNHLIDVLEE